MNLILLFLGYLRLSGASTSGQQPYDLKNVQFCYPG